MKTKDLETILSEEKALDLEKLEGVRQEVFAEAELWRHLRKAVSNGEKVKGGRRVNWGYFLEALGYDSKALELLEEAEESAVTSLTRARALISLNRLEAAAEVLEKAASEHKKEKIFPALLIETRTRLGQIDEAEKALKAFKKSFKKEKAWASYLSGCHLERAGDYEGALEAYEETLEEDETFARALFRLGYLHDLHGDSEAAKEAYEELAELDPTYTNAILNLGLKYEDEMEYKKACQCYERVLRLHPNHPRARMYLEDAEASKDMYYDEEKQRRLDRRSQILRTPITDFELSVRSRNCLNKMNIKTLGDLIQKTEAELLSYKNFGETSLQEIKEVLAQKGLRLGQGREGDPTDRHDEVLLNKPLANIEMSVRSRKCMEALGLKTLGDLIQKTEADLLTAKNFGQTSLNEVKAKLAEHGLKLKGS